MCSGKTALRWRSTLGPLRSFVISAENRLFFRTGSVDATSPFKVTGQVRGIPPRVALKRTVRVTSLRRGRDHRATTPARAVGVRLQLGPYLLLRGVGQVLERRGAANILT